MAKFTVWSLDVWGHESSECCAGYGCDGACVHVVNDEGEEREEHDDLTCQCSYTINDRCRVGSVEIPENADDKAILEILDEENYIHAGLCEIDDYSDGTVFDVLAKEHRRPLLSLESEES